MTRGTRLGEGRSFALLRNAEYADVARTGVTFCTHLTRFNLTREGNKLRLVYCLD